MLFSNPIDIILKNFYQKKNIFIAGDSKWWRAKERVLQKTKYQNDLFFRQFCDKVTNCKKKVVVFGSPHFEEHLLALEFFKYNKDFLIIYVPHEISEKKTQKIRDGFLKINPNVGLYSSSHNLENFDSIKCFLMDNIGYLAEIYSLAEIAVIGGGFDGQIHNTLEAAAHYCVPLFGPHFSRAAEAKKLIELKCAFSFESRKEFLEFLCQTVQFNGLNIKEHRNSLTHVFEKIENTAEIVYQKF